MRTPEPHSTQHQHTSSAKNHCQWTAPITTCRRYRLWCAGTTTEQCVNAKRAAIRSSGSHGGTLSAADAHQCVARDVLCARPCCGLARADHDSEGARADVGTDHRAALGDRYGVDTQRGTQGRG